MEQAIEMDTFDEGPYTDGPMDETGVELDAGSAGEEGEEGQAETKVSEQTEESEDIDPDSQVNLLDEEEVTRTEEKEEDGEKEADKPDEEAKDGDEESEDKSDSKDDDAADVGEDAEPVRTVKAFSDGKQYEIPENAEIKTKVAGKWEKPTLQDLKDNYAGKVAYDRKFTDLSEREKDYQEREETHKGEIDYITTHFKQIRQLTEAGMKGEVDPVSSMNYLLDLMGINTVDYNKAMYNHMAYEFDAYNDMTESERDAHWTKQENDYLVKRQESLLNNQKQEQTQVEFQQKVNSLREAHSISEEDYVSAEQDLKANGQETSPEKVVQAAKLKPLLMTADELIEPYLEQLDDDQADELSVEIATTMFRTPTLTIDQVKQVLAERYEVEEIVSTIEKKVGKKDEAELKVAPKRDTKYESFDDWD